jgi:hypothetical protein
MPGYTPFTRSAMILFDTLSPGASDGPMIMNGFMTTRSKPGRSRSTNAQAARSAMVFDR